MGTSQHQKAASRSAIVDAAAQRFRERGLDGVTVAQVMDAAGLTHGGLPRHFSSKQALGAEALTMALGNEARGEVVALDGVQDFADGYLTSVHRDNPGRGCAYAALGAEVARADPLARKVMSDAIRSQADEFSTIDSDGGKHLDPKAIGNWGAMIAALVLARISNSDDLSTEILTATRQFIAASE